MSERRRSILLVEDDPLISKLLCSVLQKQGYRVLPAFNAEDAVAIGESHQNPVDLLLCDVVLQDGSARSVLSRLRSLRPDMRVLLLSGYELEDLFEQELLDPAAIEDGAGFLQKPFLPAALVQAVENVLCREVAMTATH
ncbi:MAG: response regulator [Bryobacteraceae bacterium]